MKEKSINSKLTIVLTVYNKEAYLRRAFDSLLSQEGVQEDDYEVLVVNDGSTDGSAAIVEEYAREDKRVRVLTQQNQGLSMARNNGTEAAHGEYVWYVDADDRISPKGVSLICKAAEEHPDIIPIYAETEGIDKVRNAVGEYCKTGKEILLDGHWEYCGVFNVFRRAFLAENSLRFLPGIYHEDAEFTPRMLYAAKTVQVVPEVLYTVYRDPDSITQVPRAKRAFDYLTVAEHLSRFVQEKGEITSVIGKVIDSSAALDINNAFAVICQNDKEQQQLLNQAFYEKRKDLLRSLRNAASSKYRIEALFFSFFPKRYVQVYQWMKKLG